MGLIAKQMSRRKTAPASGPMTVKYPPDAAWLTHEYIALGALTRAAALQMTVAGLKSSTARGSVGIFTPSFSSNLWYEVVDAARWRFALGAIGPNQQIAADWTVEFAVSSETATVTTPGYLTRDGSLVQPATHDALRDQLLEFAAIGSAEVGAIEQAASSHGLTQACVMKEPPPDGQRIDFRVHTSLPPERVDALWIKVGFPVLAQSSGYRSWGLGLNTRHSEDNAEIRRSEGAANEYLGHAVVSGNGSACEVRVGHLACLTLVRRVELVLRSEDESVRFERLPLPIGGV